MALIKLIILIQYSAASMILFKYGKTKNTKKLLFSFGTLFLIMFFTYIGFLLPISWGTTVMVQGYHKISFQQGYDEVIYIHLLLSTISFITFIIYIYKDKYYIWLLILPVLSCTFFFILDFLNLYHYFLFEV